MLACLSLGLALVLQEPATARADRQVILRGLSTLPQLGLPGPVCVFGPDAFAVLTTDEASAEALIGAARYGRGRVLAIGHDSYLGGGAAPNRPRARLYANALRWAAGGEAPSPERIGHLPQDLEKDCAVLLWSGGELGPAQTRRLLDRVRSGVGLICAMCPWGWQQLHPHRSLREDFAMNQVLSVTGLAFGPRVLRAPEGRFSVEGSRPAEVHVGGVLARWQAGDRQRGFHLLEQALRAIPDEDLLFLPNLEAWLKTLPPTLPPTPDHPLAAPDALARLEVLWRERRLAWEDPAHIEAVPGADRFPGAPPCDAPRLSRPFVADHVPRGWLSTGSYLAPGEALTVVIRKGSPHGWRLRIGSHSDDLGGLASWKRWPRISLGFDLESTEADGVHRYASPYGGLIYLEAEAGAQAPLHLELQGVVEAPFFRLDDPGALADWPRARQAPAPWAEIAGAHVILTVPASGVRDLDDPDAVARFWDAVLAAHCELAATPLPERPERIVADAQISAGYMHSGYPIMTWLDVATAQPGHSLPLVLDAARLRKEGSWGHFHELGHNRQRSDWTFAGTGEVTCNLFTLHAMQFLCGIDPWEHPWLAGQKEKAAAYLAAGADFEAWKRDPGVALVCYAQIIHAFGWEPFRKVFAEYRILPDSERPRDDAQKRDQWMLRMSRAVGRDLGPFFARWGIPLSARVRKQTRGLPRWMPDFAALGPAAQ